MAEDQIAGHAIMQNTEVLSDKKSEDHVSDLFEEEYIIRHKYFIFCCIIFLHCVYQFGICLYQLTLFCRLTALFQILICSTMKNGL